MKATIPNRMKLWWHLITHFHREYSDGKQYFCWYYKENISCWDCGYGGQGLDIEKLAKFAKDIRELSEAIYQALNQDINGKH